MQMCLALKFGCFTTCAMKSFFLTKEQKPQQYLVYQTLKAFCAFQTFASLTKQLVSCVADPI